MNPATHKRQINIKYIKVAGHKRDKKPRKYHIFEEFCRPFTFASDPWHTVTANEIHKVYR